MVFVQDNIEYSLLETRKKFTSPVFRIEDGYRDERDFSQMVVGIPYNTRLVGRSKVVVIIRKS